MQLDQQFTIPIGIDEAWPALLDIQRVARAFPGATLASYTDDSFTGNVKVKLGPVQLSYRGEAKFTEIDEVGHRVALTASGTDTKGNGTAAADVTAVLTESSDGTTVCDLTTTLDITGRAAQFGRGIVVDIGNRLLSQFARNLERSFAEPEPERAPTAAPAAVSPPPVSAVAATGSAADPSDQDSLDMFGLLWSSPAGRRLIVGFAGSVLLVLLLLTRRTARRSAP